MGELLHIGSHRRVPLVAHTVIGRAQSCQLRLEQPDVSASHASLTWTGQTWVLRDLGSRNGTRVGGEALDPGVARCLDAGDELAFGTGEAEWRLVDASAPLALARSGERVVQPADGLILLPSSEEPELVLLFDPDLGWVVEDGEQQRVVHDGEIVAAGGQPWQLFLPTPLEATFESADVMPDVQDITVDFEVSQDEEYVRVALRSEGWRSELAPRSYHYMMLTLARLKLDDASAGLPTAEQGWVHREELAKMLRVGPRTLTVHLCRAYQQVGEAGVLGAADFFEHRPSTRQVRLAASVGEVRPLA
ncbi:MAG: FHA domain-containing protein [Deltaproteobacteria bacterium]|nr:MAG: FHA domain-containing protein [Deltaproteobacteria bacterium]